MRQDQGIQQRELAARVGISRQALSELEAGKACPSTAVALALARALRCKVEDLFAADAAPSRARVHFRPLGRSSVDLWSAMIW